MSIDSNPMKILFYGNRLSQIVENIIPYPVMLEIDPCDFCNFNCSWCSSKRILDCKKQKHVLTENQFDHILKFIDHTKTVKGVYFVGGGEPTLNPKLPLFMKKIKQRGINNYITNNGSNLLSMGEELIDLCRWVAVSVNSGSEKQWRNVFQTKMSYERYLDGCKKMNSYNKSSGKNIETTFKCVFDTETCVDIEKAYFLAIDLGFTDIIIRPVDLFIYKRDEKQVLFNEIWPENKVEIISQMIENIKNLNKNDPVIKLNVGGFYGNMDQVRAEHKDNHTCKCWTGILDPVFGADGNIHICCVRRGEKIIGRWDDGKLCDFWGSEEHKKIVWGFNPNSECPRKCKHKSYNQIFQDIYVDKRFSEGHI